MKPNFSNKQGDDKSTSIIGILKMILIVGIGVGIILSLLINEIFLGVKVETTIMLFGFTGFVYKLLTHISEIDIERWWSNRKTKKSNS